MIKRLMMKKLGCVLLAGLTFIACKDSGRFVIKGEFQNAAPQSKVYLFALDKANAVALDSTVLSDKGEFKFNHATSGVDFFKVTAGSNEYMIIAKNGDQIKLEADLSDKDMHYNISGTEEADKLEDLNTTKNKYMFKIMAIQKEFEDLVAKDPQNRAAIMDSIRPKYMQKIEELNALILKFAKENPSSLAGFYAINLLNPSDYEKEMVDYSDQIKGNLSQNPSVKDFLKRMTALKAVQIGQIAPDFKINTIDGKTIKLSDFRGKYLLLDFWASWCQPCRQENPNVVKAYNTFKDKNFTILGISLDKDVAAWKQAVQADHLTWTHGSELQDFEGPTVRLYQIEAIPSSFLLDPAGKIIAKNLRGTDLEDFLNKTLSKS